MAVPNWLRTGLMVGLLVAVSVGGARLLRGQAKTVAVTFPTRRVVVESIAVSGEMRGRVETSVGAQASGRVVQMWVREGDRVRAGQKLARLDDAVVQAQVTQAQQAVLTSQTQVEQARDGIATAEALLQQAARPALAADVARVRAETTQNVAVAQAKLAGARQRLAELTQGDTSEQRQQVEAQVEQARASLELAEKEYARQQSLYRQGAIAVAAFDTSATNQTLARKTLDNLLARQRQQEVGTRREAMEQAQSDVRAQAATVQGAKATGEAQLRALLAIPRREDVVVAENKVREARRAETLALARLLEAQGARDVARRRVTDTLVTAPFAGTVTQIVTEVGGVAAANQPLVRLVRTSRPEIRASVDEKYLGQLRVGQEAVVTADAYPGQQVRARIREIGAQINLERGTIEVRLDPRAAPVWMRPNQTLSVNILLGQGTPRLLVPLSTVTSVGGTSWVLVVAGGVVQKRPIEAGSVGAEGVPVRAGLQEKDAVVLAPGEVEVGERAYARPPSGKGGQSDGL